MNAFIDNLKDPAFMFPALLIAIIAGIVVSCLRSGGSWLISYLTGRLNEKKAASQKKLEEDASWAASNPILLNQAVVGLSSVHTDYVVLWAAFVILLCIASAVPLRTASGSFVLYASIGFIVGGLSRTYMDRRYRKKKVDKAIDIFLTKTKKT